MAKSPKISNVFNPGRQLNAASRERLEIQASSLAKRRNLSNQKITEESIVS